MDNFIPCNFGFPVITLHTQIRSKVSHRVSVKKLVEHKRGDLVVQIDISTGYAYVGLEAAARILDLPLCVVQKMLPERLHDSEEILDTAKYCNPKLTGTMLRVGANQYICALVGYWHQKTNN